MKEIVELNSKLLHPAGNRKPENILIFRRDDVEDLLELPPALQAELESIRTRIHQVMPNDFNYTLFLGDDSADFTIEYEDGPQTQFFRAHAFCPDTSLFEQLKNYDWDAERAQAIQMGQTMDTMKEQARHEPSRLPSTKQLQKAFRDDMKEFIKTNRKDQTKVHVLLFREEEGLKSVQFETLDKFSHDLPDIMTVQLLVITVVLGGKPLPIEKIEALKKQAVAELEDMPLSHAKALHKIPAHGGEVSVFPPELLEMALKQYQADLPCVGTVNQDVARRYVTEGTLCRGQTVIDQEKVYFHVIKSPLHYPNPEIFFAESEEQLLGETIQQGCDAGISLDDLFGQTQSS